MDSVSRMTIKKVKSVTSVPCAPHLLFAGSEVDPDPGCHGFGVSKESVEPEGELLQIFSLDVAECRLRVRDAGTFDY